MDNNDDNGADADAADINECCSCDK